MTDSHADTYFPTVEYLTSNGVTLPEGATLTESFSYEPSDFEGSGIQIDGPMPGLLMKINKDLWRAFSLLPVATNQEEKRFKIQEGDGTTGEEAKQAALAKTITAIRREIAIVDVFIAERAATG